MTNPDQVPSIQPILIQDEMRRSYLDYAMSVIVGRALPDVRDGLKPVHRRVLYAMYDQSNTYNKPYKKSARIVGDVIGKYHPHGDSAVYDTMVRMVQDFSLRYPLIDGQGNFGSVDGDNAAAMRYTEVRMKRLTNELLSDLDKETVDFQPNYDESLQEPKVLPTKVPNLLMNGSSGIAVGMATNIAPHNLGELVKGLQLLLQRPDATADELRALIPAPDFPTGGLISGASGIRDAFNTGRGIVKIRARTQFEEVSKNKQAIIITELPYQVNKARLIEKIAELVSDKKLDGISDLRDESDREGMRVVIEIKKNDVPEVVLNRLFSMTQMETSFGVNNVALIHGQPRLLSTREMLVAFLDFRREVIIRRTRYELRKAEERAHILEGLVKALDHLDAVIALIRAARDPEIARTQLCAEFGFSDIQAQAILEMRLQRLTGLERDKIVAEYNEILIKIADLKDILARPERVSVIISGELSSAVNEYDNPRRSEITTDLDDIDIEDMIADDPMVVTVSHNGYVKRTATHVYEAQKRGGRGKIGMQTREEDFVARMFVATAHQYLLCFTDKGRVHWLKVHRVPESGRNARGLPIVNLLDLQEKDEQVTTILPVRAFDDMRNVLMVTRQGVTKRTSLSAFGNVRKAGIIALDLDEGDRLVQAAITDGSQRIVIATRQGQAVQFEETDVRVMGRGAGGVRGISLADDDYVIAVALAEPGADLLTVSERGYGKRSAADDYRITRRGGKGVRTLQVTDKTGQVAGVVAVKDGDELMLIADSGRIIRFRVDELRTLGRATQGVKLLNLEEGESVASLALIPAALVADVGTLAETAVDGGSAEADADA